MIGKNNHVVRSWVERGLNRIILDYIEKKGILPKS